MCVAVPSGVTPPGRKGLHLSGRYQRLVRCLPLRGFSVNYAKEDGRVGSPGYQPQLSRELLYDLGQAYSQGHLLEVLTSLPISLGT